LCARIRRHGNAALGQYDDRGEPLLVAEEFRALLTGGNLLPLPVPGLMAYLEEYPRSQPSGAEDFFYWSTVDFGLKPTVRVNHVIVYPLAGGPSGVSHVIAIKQLYASHYFQTTLELRFLVDDASRAIVRPYVTAAIAAYFVDRDKNVRTGLRYCLADAGVGDTRDRFTPASVELPRRPPPSIRPPYRSVFRLTR
jgi:hypothetical protein